MRSRSDVLALLRERPAWHTLPRAFYNDADVYTVDLEAIWHRDWIYAAAGAELPEPGAFATLEIGAYPLILVRGADGVVRAFHNSCRHRGSRICTARHGTAEALVCPVHRWTYGLDGALVRTPPMGPGFEPSDHALGAVHCREIQGMVYVCLAEAAPGTADLEREAARYIGPHGPARLKVAHQARIVEEANWKLVLENNRECYHCVANHPALCVVFPDDPNLVGADDSTTSNEGLAHVERCEAAGLPARYVIDASEQWRFVRIPFLDGATSFTLDGKAAVSRRLGTVPFDDAGSCLFFHFPNTWNHFLSDQVVTFRVLPLGPTRTEVVTTWLVHADAVEGVDYDLERLTRVWIETNDEDRRIVEGNQKGTASPAYEPGPYSRLQEGGVSQFVDWYARTLGERLAALEQERAAEERAEQERAAQPA